MRCLGLALLALVVWVASVGCGKAGERSEKAIGSSGSERDSSLATVDSNKALDDDSDPVREDAAAADSRPADAVIGEEADGAASDALGEGGMPDAAKPKDAGKDAATDVRAEAQGPRDASVFDAGHVNPELSASECKDICKAEAKYHCERGLSQSLCEQLCMDPNSLPVPGSNAEDIAAFFRCAKGKVFMCDDEGEHPDNIPEVRDCDMFAFKQWIGGNDYLDEFSDSGYH
jgi:hypothetical protein